MAIDALASGWAKAVGVDRKQFDMFFDKMLNGVAYHRIVVNGSGKPVDYVFLEVNLAFEKMTGLKRKRIIGKKVTEVLPGIEKDPADWIGIYGNVALMGKSVQFENYNEALGKWFKVSSYCPDKGYFVALFEDITERRKSEDDLRQNEKRYHSLFEAVSGGIVVQNQDGSIVEANEKACEILGLTRDQIQGRTSTDVNWHAIHEDKSPFPGDKHPAMITLKTGKALQNVVMGLFHPNTSQYRWIIINSEPIIDAKTKKVTASVATFVDITDQKKAEETLAFNSSLAENLSEAVISTDLDYRIRTWNKAAEDIYGFKEAEVIGKVTVDVLKSEIPDESVKQAALKLMENSSWRGEAVQMKKDGSLVNILSSVSLIRDKVGNPVAIVAVNRDITRRKRNEEALRKQAALIDLSPDGILIRKTEGTITFWSQGAETLYGWSKDEAIGQQTHKLLKTQFPESFESIVDQIRVSGRWSGELIHTTKVGLEVVVQSLWMSRRDNNGEMVEILESNVDVTHLKQIQYKLEEYAANMEKLVEERTKQLKDSERLAAIGATAGMVGHDIRNPLQAISGDVYLLKEDLKAMPEREVKSSIKESLEGIEKNVDYINKIVADLQDFARPLNPKAGETDLKLVIEDLLKKNGSPENIEVSVEVEDDARKVVADSTFINRIMYNLVNNAVQAMPKGGKLTMHAFKEANDVLITVKDTGVGIPEANKAKLFTPMFTTKSKGQGFGLVVIKRMTEALGGVVSFDSQEGIGTTFTVKLPQRSFMKERT